MAAACVRSMKEVRSSCCMQWNHFQLTTSPFRSRTGVLVSSPGFGANNLACSLIWICLPPLRVSFHGLSSTVVESKTADQATRDSLDQPPPQACEHSFGSIDGATGYTLHSVPTEGIKKSRRVLQVLSINSVVALSFTRSSFHQSCCLTVSISIVGFSFFLFA